MGLFDRLIVPCPACGAEIEFQSKAGECFMESYTIENVPAAIAGDLIGAQETCDVCHRSITLIGHVWLQPVPGRIEVG